MIELRGVTKAFGDLVALAPTDLECATGETTVLIGPSGCGKSTLLKLMNGLIEADGGDVLVEGQRLEPASALELRRRIGYVIQEGGLFPHLSARGNVELVARYLGWAESRRRERVGELAELARLPSSSLERFPSELSGGQRQRVGLMRAMMLDPPVLLLDEPLGALDPMVRAELQEDLRRIVRSADKTVVLVTHDMGEAVFFAGKIVLLRDGRIVQQGSASDLVHSPAEDFVRDFISAQRSPLEELA